MGRRRSFAVVTLVALTFGLTAPAAHANEFTRPLSRGDEGRDVRELEFRVAGWFPSERQARLVVNKVFDWRTERAVKRFQNRHGLVADGIAGPKTFAALARLEDGNGSTRHFDWREFKQNYNQGCSAKANAYSGTFDGGLASKLLTRRFVRRLMWRLEALRDKAGDNPVGINSGFRSVPYNDCIGGARGSQHLYGTAADNRVAHVTNRTARDIARRSQFYGIACYSSQTHNHFDLRLENFVYSDGRFWWWPDQDKGGRDLASTGSPCWGEKEPSSGVASLADPPVPTTSDIRAFEFAGEPDDLEGSD